MTIIYISVIVAVTIIVMEVIALIALNKHTKNKSKSDLEVIKITDQTERLKLYINHDFDKINDRIDKYINEAGEIYKMNHFEYKERDQIYLTQEMMDDMIKFMIQDVMKRITPAVFSLLQLSYNINDQQALILFLYEKIKMYVLGYSLDTNREVEEFEY